jgi:hypothetical protein
VAYNLTPEQLAAAGQQVIDEGTPPEDLYDMGRRHQFEVAALDQKNKEEQAFLEQNQAVYDDQMQTWENQGVQPDNLARAKAQLASYFGTPGTQPVPGAQNASVSASPTQGDLINPANPMKLV